jgi:polygalacturonase
VKAFGAKGDGKTLDADAINSAIAAAHAAGGGIVRLGAGTYLSTSIRLQSHAGVLISGIPAHEIEDLRLSDIRIAYQGGGTTPDAALRPEEKETEYPEPDMFGNIPAYGLYARHVKALSARDLVFTTDKPDARPAFLFEDAAGVDLDRMIVLRPMSAVFVLQRVTDFLLRNSPGLPDKRLPKAVKESF